MVVMVCLQNISYISNTFNKTIFTTPWKETTQSDKMFWYKKKMVEKKINNKKLSGEQWSEGRNIFLSMNYIMCE